MNGQPEAGKTYRITCSVISLTVEVVTVEGEMAYVRTGGGTERVRVSDFRWYEVDVSYPR